MNVARASNQVTLLAVAPTYTAYNNATARVAYGAAAQEIVCAALDLRPIPINGNCDVCFDAESDASFYEIKSVRRGHKTVIYDWRMKKEAAAGYPLQYAILIHKLKGQRQDIMMEMARREPMILILDHRFVHKSALEEPLRTITSFNTGGRRNGYRREGYVDGYRNVPIKKLMALAPNERRVDFMFYGKSFNISLLTQHP